MHYCFWSCNIKHTLNYFLSFFLFIFQCLQYGDSNVMVHLMWFSFWFLLGFILFIQPGALFALLTFASNHHPLSSCFILKLVIIFLIYCFPTTVIYIPDSSLFDLTLISIATHCSGKTHFVTCSQWFYRTDFIIIYSSINFCVICNFLSSIFLGDHC